MGKFKVGDLVVPTERARKKFDYNDFGEGWGEVTHTGYKYRPDFEYHVEWKGGRPASYNEEHLEPYIIDLENK